MQALLLFSHQPYPQVVRQPRTTVMYMVEDIRLFQPSKNPAEAVFHRAAFQALRERLLVKGFAVEYLGADEVSSFDHAFRRLAKAKPEVVRTYDTSDPELSLRTEQFTREERFPLQMLPSPVLVPTTHPRGTYVPEVLPPVYPNRYVEEAATYFATVLRTPAEIEFAYPVTPGDTEEWLDLLPGHLRAGKELAALARDLTPVLASGLMQREALERVLALPEIPPQHASTFRTLLFG